MQSRKGWPAARHIRFAALARIQPRQHRLSAARRESAISAAVMKILHADRRDQSANVPRRADPNFGQRATGICPRVGRLGDRRTGAPAEAGSSIGRESSAQRERVEVAERPRERVDVFLFPARDDPEGEPHEPVGHAAGRDAHFRGRRCGGADGEHLSGPLLERSRRNIGWPCWQYIFGMRRSRHRTDGACHGLGWR